MIRLSPLSSSSLSFNPNSRHTLTMSNIKTTTFNNVSIRSDSSPTHNDSKESKKIINESLSCSGGFCSCARLLFQSVGKALFPTHPSNASDLHPDDPTAVLYRFHPPRPDWYEELYASILNTCTKGYEAEVAGYKSQLFANLRGNAKEILEIGVGTGPNLKYYSTDTNVRVFGIDPNRKMEKYAQAAAEAARLPPTNFKFMHAVAEALPLSDASVDAVVGTLILCSVKDVDLTLQEVRRVLKPGGLFIFVEHVAAEDGTFLRFVQGVLNPLQQKVADGCHLTRKTGKSISEAGFSSVDINTAFLSTNLLVGPHVYGIACK